MKKQPIKKTVKKTVTESKKEFTYVDFLTKILTENTDNEILKFAEDLIEGMKIRGSILKENKTPETTSKKSPEKSRLTKSRR